MQQPGDLKRLLEEHREQTARLEAAVLALEQADLSQENDRLREENLRLVEELDQFRSRLDQAEAEAARLAADNRDLHGKWRERVERQRRAVVSGARQDVDAVIGAQEKALVSGLAAHNKALRGRLTALRGQLEGAQSGAAAELLEQVASLEHRVQLFMRQSSGALSQSMGDLRSHADAAVAALEGMPIPPLLDPDKEKRSGKDSLELRLGSKVTVVVGVFFMLLAVIFGLRYTYLYLLHSDLVKGLVAYLLGLVFLGGGEILNRRQRSPFSIGICAGGVAILFASTAVSYFSLGILSIPLALGICVAITALALVQAVRYDSMLIAIFALIGGYLPMAALDGSPVLLVSAMVYFLLLQLFVLGTALKKRWQVLKFFSLVLGLLGVNHLLWLESYASTAGGILYVMANFLMILAIVLVYPILRQDLLRKSDTVLLAIGTAASCGFVFLLLHRGGWDELNGMVALGFCALFFAGAKWLGKVLEQDAGAKGLFYATAFAFWALAVPLQFQPSLIGLAWLCEGVALYVFGAVTDRKWYRRAGGVLTLLCCASFFPYLVEYTVFSSWWHMDGLLVWRYGAFTVGVLAVASVGRYAYGGDNAFWKSGEGVATLVFRYAALVNLWLFAVYCVLRELNIVNLLWHRYWTGVLLAAATLGLGVCYRAIPQLRDRVMLVIARVLYVLGFVLALYAGGIHTPGFGLRWLAGFILLLALDAGAVLAFRDFVLGFGSLGREWAGIMTAGFALALAVQILLVQGAFGIRSMAVSFVLIAWALGLILYGFVGGYPAMRRCGLGLSLLSVSKLFLLDLSFLQSGQRILSYFVFGAVFIGIAWVYQVFSKRYLADAPASPAGEPAQEEE